MDGFPEQALVSVGRQGRVGIPARIRRALSIEPGDALVARVVDGRIVLEKRADVLARKSLERGVKVGGLRDDLTALGLTLVPSTIQDAERAAPLRGPTKELGLPWPIGPASRSPAGYRDRRLRRIRPGTTSNLFRCALSVRL